jgi:hypothetical protein
MFRYDPRFFLPISNAIDYAKFRSRSHDAVIRVYDTAGNVIKTHEHAASEFNKMVKASLSLYLSKSARTVLRPV